MKSIMKKGGRSLALFLAILCLNACMPTNGPESLQLVIMLDQTETETAVAIQSDLLLQFLMDRGGVDLSKLTDSEITLIVTPLNGMRNNIPQTVRLAKGKGLQSNPKQRLEEQRQFLERANQAIVEVKEDRSMELRQSYIAKPIVRQLRRLHNTSSQRKIALLVTDLMDNNQSSSFYHMNEEETRQSLEKAFADADFYGIEVYNYYSPSTVATDEYYEVVKPIWEEFFLDTGADFTFISSLK